ncbi:MAG: peptidylprolyl isomerase, partial [Planctomycetota bacterium]
MNGPRLLLTACFALFLTAGALSTAQARDKNKETVVVMKTTQGDITLRFFPEKAPEHVKNFLHHAKSGLYTKTYFHRVMTNFMIQGGNPNTKDDDPANDGSGGYSYKGKGKLLKAEFNDTPHLRGVLSMARLKEP